MGLSAYNFFFTPNFINQKYKILLLIRTIIFKLIVMGIRLRTARKETENTR